MGSFSIWHLVVLLVFVVTPVAMIALTTPKYRVRRKRYALGLLAALVLTVFAGVIAEQQREGDGISDIAMVVMFALLGWSFYLIRLSAGRAQDAGFSKWIVLLTAIPLVNLVLVAVLLVKPSKALTPPLEPEQLGTTA